MLPHGLSKPEDMDAKSIISMQELDPSPVDDLSPDLESGEYFPRPEDSLLRSGNGSSISKLGLRGHRWDAWLSGLQRYSTYPPTAFFALHFTNTALIPLLTRSVPASEPYLLLTRPIYQAPGLEHIVLTIPVLAHIVSGVVLRNIRASRRARLYGAETRAQRDLLSFWPRVSLQARSGYLLAPLIGVHVLVNRATPVMVDGGSSGVGLGRLLTTPENKDRTRRQRKMWWIVNGIATVGASIWLGGALGIIGRAGEGAGWEAKGWNEIYSQVPIIGAWL
ncbi:hypothetical protein NUU61_003675 [Penicillium alfredii]|uniref:Mitochondrial adapter protein MCP1 transmembrane domain-containing protein n=1 Tax=Penicillium alfredii TaxID=1506179 RepID=A0A9W9FJM7_9EURO|nr:uncharacterized protein NUU61_003675 [Penicillium alfredii]KAJ5101453.1 hypothetical protein NUU61_003675 [Penicillium alfredii]